MVCGWGHGIYWNLMGAPVALWGLLRKNEWEDMEVGLLDLEYVKQRLALRRRSFIGIPQMEPKYQMDLLPMMMAVPPVPPFPMMTDDVNAGDGYNGSFISDMYETCESRPKAKNQEWGSSVATRI